MPKVWYNRSRLRIYLIPAGGKLKKHSYRDTKYILKEGGLDKILILSGPPKMKGGDLIEKDQDF
jgi:hypothetical protein